MDMALIGSGSFRPASSGCQVHASALNPPLLQPSSLPDGFILQTHNRQMGGGGKYSQTVPPQQS